MTAAVSKILAEIEQLSPPERAEVASAVLLFLGPLQEDTGDIFEGVLARRAEDIRSGKVAGRPAEEVFARLKARRS